jgi:hypothetical protein
MKQWQVVSLTIPDDDPYSNDSCFRFELHDDDGTIVEVIDVEFPGTVDPEMPDAHPLDEETVEDRAYAMLAGLILALARKQTDG